MEPYVLYKKGFEAPVKHYFLKYTIYTLATLLAGFIVGQCLKFIPDNAVIAFISKVIVCLLITNAIFFLLFYQTKEFKYLWSIIKMSY